jgi:diguanylate cyclase (GGDEF)-like protein/PAS domain S-box-containing protein
MTSRIGSGVDTNPRVEREDEPPTTTGKESPLVASRLGACRHQLELKSLLLESIGDGILAYTLEGHIVYANHRAAEMLGYSLSELTDIAPWGWVAPDARHSQSGRTREIRTGSGLVYEARCHTRDGLQVCAEVHSRIVEIEPWGELVVSVARDMAERSAAHETMHRLAFYDRLTGLSNRAMLDDRIEAALSGSHRREDTVGIIYMDLDDFKPINDTHGHGVGDRVLRTIAQRMQACVRDADTVARVGGDEFIAMFPGLTDRVELSGKARAIAECVSQPIVLDDITVRVSVSVGLATHQNDEHHDELIARADHAMYRAKLHGLAGWEEFLANA